MSNWKLLVIETKQNLNTGFLHMHKTENYDDYMVKPLCDELQQHDKTNE